MKITEKIKMDMEGLIKNGPITIVAFGDSITHGSLGFNDANNYESVYWNRLRKKINNYSSGIPVNVINAGIGGTSAKWSIERTDAQVLSHNPDLVIVCFGLNDVNGTLEDYIDSLGIIFDKCNKNGTETIFLSPNMLNTYVTKRIKTTDFAGYAAKTAEMQNSGRMDKYIYAACDKARSMNVAVCDCYSKWKELSKIMDTTKLLANDINHPIKEMHELFAVELFKCIFKESNEKENLNDYANW